MDIKWLSIRDLEIQLRKYISDAAKFAAGAPLSTTTCYLDGIRTPEQLSDAIKEHGDAYIKKIKALRDARPVVRGDTISIHGPKPELAANAPSHADFEFMVACRKQLLAKGFVRAADADIYEEIAKKYPAYAHPARVRGSEARRWIRLHEPDVVTKALKKKWKR